jgi:2-phospho-L-lactate guanylyltransferase
MWAIVPIKALESAKRRLADVLSPPERRALMLAMARDVLTALARCRRLRGVLIVSRTSEADALAQAFGTERFAESPDADLSAALTQAAEYLRERLQARGVMIVPADVPLIAPDEIDEILAGHDAVTIMPDDEHLGTNGLICTPADAIGFNFDGRSFRPHLEAACRAGINPRVVPSPRFGLDVDTPDDLKALLARGPATQTATFLHNAGVAGRLGVGLLDGCGSDPHNGRLKSGP